MAKFHGKISFRMQIMLGSTKVSPSVVQLYHKWCNCTINGAKCTTGNKLRGWDKTKGLLQYVFPSLRHAVDFNFSV